MTVPFPFQSPPHFLMTGSQVELYRPAGYVMDCDSMPGLLIKHSSCEPVTVSEIDLALGLATPRRLDQSADAAESSGNRRCDRVRGHRFRQNLGGEARRRSHAPTRRRRASRLHPAWRWLLALGAQAQPLP